MSELDREDLRTEYRAVCDYELAVSGMRFQTLSLFLAAVGLIVGLSNPSRAVGALLLLISLGLWIIDLRNRALLNIYREMGAKLEKCLHGTEAILFSRRETPATFGVPNGRWKRKPRKVAGVVSFQVGFDVIFFAVMGYGLSMIVAHHGWWWLVLFPLAIVAVLVTTVRAIGHFLKSADQQPTA